MANTAAPVSLILLGSQTIWAHSELIGPTANETPPMFQDAGVDHGRVPPGGRPPARSPAGPIRGSDAGAAHIAKFNASLYAGQAILFL